MGVTLLTAGIGFVLAAILGGGLTAFGVQMPVFHSVWRQLLLAVCGLSLMYFGWQESRIEKSQATRSDVSQASSSGPAPRQSEPQQAPQEQSEATSTSQVDANGWTDTGVYIRAGQQLRIEATGSWTTWGERQDIRPQVGPAGYAGDWDRQIVEQHSQWNYEDFKRALPVSSAPSGALIGRISAYTFYVGPSVVLRPVQSGELFLGCNDIDSNNLGSMTATIVVR